VDSIPDSGTLDPSIMRFTLFSLSLILVVQGCGGSSAGPSSTISSITVSASNDMWLVGTSTTLTATALRADGSDVAVTAPAWSSDTPGVFTIDQSGVARAIAPGIATLSVDFQGRRGSKQMRVVPNVSGTWQGQWRHTAFTPVAGPGCGSLILGSMSVVNLSLTQSRDTATGTLNLAGVIMNVSGTIAANGTLAIAGQRDADRQSVSDWASTVSSDTMTGTFNWNITYFLGFSNPTFEVACRILDTLVGVARTAPGTVTL
jgi:hypothetical protein